MCYHQNTDLYTLHFNKHPWQWTTGSVVAQIFELEACHLETESMFHKNEKTYEDCCWMFI